MDDKRHSWYVTLPYLVLVDKSLPSTAKLILAEIFSLVTYEKPFYYGSNTYIAELFGLAPAVVSTHISKLEKKGYIKVEVLKDEGNKRIIWLTDKLTPIKKNLKNYTRKPKDPYIEKSKQSNIIDKKYKENPQEAEAKAKDHLIRQVVTIFIKVCKIDTSALIGRDYAMYYTMTKRLIERTKDISLLEEGFRWLEKQRLNHTPAMLDKFWQSFLRDKKKKEVNDAKPFFYDAETDGGRSTTYKN